MKCLKLKITFSVILTMMALLLIIFTFIQPWFCSPTEIRGTKTNGKEYDSIQPKEYYYTERKGYTIIEEGDHIFAEGAVPSKYEDGSEFKVYSQKREI